jgi:pimeloyl-ACP methyl ester carboxylesterase
MLRLSRVLTVPSVISFSIACGQGTTERSLESAGNAASDYPATQAVEPAAPVVSALDWQPCQNGFECANVDVPRDYSDPEGPTLTLAVTRLRAADPAHRIGSLFINYGGPGDPVIDQLHDGGGSYWGGKNPRFDIVGFDPRGVGHSPGAFDCKAHGEDDGPAPPYFVTPQNLDREALRQYAQHYVDACLANNDPDVLSSASTGNAARDLDVLRVAVGDEKLSFLGFSYGTVLGATYASLFPQNYRALVLDGGMDADQYLNRPGDYAMDQSAAFEAALDRFFQACAGEPSVCDHFGGEAPALAFDELVARAHVTPIPAGANLLPVSGDEILGFAAQSLYRKQDWRVLASALAAASRGNATQLRTAYDARSDWLAASDDQFINLQALEQNWESDIEAFVEQGDRSWELFPHFWWNSGYDLFAWGLFPIEAAGVFRGPFQVPPEAASVLVVGTTHDPATPYHGAQVLTETLQNARLLTMDGDGHTAYGGNSPCINGAVEAYLADGTLPAVGTACPQEVRF